MSADPYRYFRVEAADLLVELQKGVLELSRGESSAAPVGRLLRAAHTFKSAARVVRLAALGDEAHAMEELLAPLRDRAVPASADVIESLHAHLATIERGLAAISEEAPAGDTPSESSATTQARVESSGRDAIRVLRAEVGEVDELVEGLGSAHVELLALRDSFTELARTRAIVELLMGQLAPRTTTSAEARGRAYALAGDMRVALGDLDRTVAAGIERVTREIAESRQAAERLRLVPAAVLFDVLERTALDAARALGRRVSFRSSGRDVRLDAHVLALAQDALVQIVRNAIAHGIENEAERRRAGKPLEGVLTVTVERRAGRVVFTCRDDGRGVDLEAVRRAARRKGVVLAGAESAEELLGLMIGGGLSTSTDVTAIAGRGIGMDVVRTAAERMGGEVRVRTHANHGTEIELAVPLALSALDVLLVRANEQTFGLTIDAVVSTRRVSREEIAPKGDGDTIIEGGRAIPFASLTRCLQLSDTAGGAVGAESVVIVRAGAEQAAIGVDRLLGIVHLVLRPLPELALADDAVGGIALDAAGDAIVVLDSGRIVARARGAPRRVAESREALPILVVDDSLTTRMLEQSILESAGYRVELAVSGEDALLKLGATRFALALIDVEMPGIDGFEVIRRIRADASVRDLPAILVTSRNAPEDLALGRAVGASDYIVKGEFNQSLLLGRIRELVA